MARPPTPDPGAGWGSLTAGSPLRTYQRHAVDTLMDQLATNGGRACLVAPPGSGKTRVALHVAASLGRFVEVRVPTRSLAMQWSDRLTENLVDLADAGTEPPVQIDTYAKGAAPRPGSLVVLDEAHHLGGSWGRTLRSQLGGDHRVLGLTATPPWDSRRRGPFEALVGDDPVIVQTPPLVREGSLCPYQDLVWPVLGNDDDAPELSNAWDRLKEQVDDELYAWIAVRLREDRWTLTEARFRDNDALLVALCRIRHARGQDLPLDLPPDPELRADPTLADWATVLWAHGTDAAREAVRSVGFRPVSSGLVLDRDVAWVGLAASKARHRGCIEVLAVEHEARGDGLRALILTERDVESDRLSARSLLRDLVADPRSDSLDPILVSGTALWVDDDLYPKIRDRLPDVPAHPTGGHVELDIAGWPTERRVAVVTTLLREGVTRCLVGTRHLLGEGWDCPAVNVVVDLTGIGAFVTVHQVRGRALRIDPADPSKTASLWEVPVVVPGVPGGERMLEGLVRRHAHTFGVNERGQVIAGVDRIDPVLRRPPQVVALELADLRDRMRQRLMDAPALAARWAIGQDYRDTVTFSVAADTRRRITRRRTDARPQRPVEPAIYHLSAPAPPPTPLWIGGLATAGAAGGMVEATGLLLAVAGLVGVGAGLGLVPWLLETYRWGTRIGRWAAGRPPGDLGRATALHAAMVDQQLVEGELRHEDTHVWLDGDPDAAKRFAQALAELLGAVRYPRYLLLEADGSVWPVPHALGGQRERADALAVAWAEWVGPCEVLWARQGRGRTLLEAAWRTVTATTPTIREVWG